MGHEKINWAQKFLNQLILEDIIEFVKVLFVSLIFVAFSLNIFQEQFSAVAVGVLFFVLYYGSNMVVDLLGDKPTEYFEVKDELTRRIRGIYHPTTEKLINIAVLLIALPLFVFFVAYLLSPVLDWIGILKLIKLH